MWSLLVLILQGVCQLSINSDLPSWTKALNNNEDHFLTAINNPSMQKTIEGKVPSFESLLSTLGIVTQKLSCYCCQKLINFWWWWKVLGWLQDFRIPKPASGVQLGRETTEHIHIKGSTISLSKGTTNETRTHIKDVGSVRMSAKLKPLFMERKPAPRSTQSGKLDIWTNFGFSFFLHYANN